ncbi:MAG TPA: histidine kinase [Chitinophagales bacterium]|jgi:two-component system LytT family sensor kinase|nr:histidine kinase [Chitinophagales bacterium]MBP6153394.1 histidine kinase [Chitinophagales bacterium]HQV79121.1 histidine kinase [Chitinophagales bacterium]HQW79923.1 histidine kinase [Chitinophagales bacterium]HRB19398.1 histidine kinase [Chitinophagales bacterium]
MQLIEQLKLKLEDNSLAVQEKISIWIELSSNLMPFNVDEALTYNKLADDHFVATDNNQIQYGLILNNFGVYYYMKNLNELALEKFIAADKILSKSANKEHHILAKADIALIYTRTEQYQQALDIYLQIESELKGIPVGIRHAQIYINIDAAYVYVKDFENALRYSLKALEIVEHLQHPFGRAISYVNTGGNYLQLGDTEKAKTCIDKAHELALQHKIESLNCSIYLKYAEYFSKMHEYTKAVEFGMQSLAAAEEKKSDEQAMFVCGRLIEFYEQIEDYKQALQMSKQFNNMKQSALANDKMQMINAMQLQYNTEKKELELSELKVKQQQLEIEKRDSELAALKSQMNPHFIFNALNSIQELYMIGDKRIANEQMGNFAMLTRKILNVSGKQKIDLSEEIDILSKYLELESMRFENDFFYSIDFSNKLDEDYVQLPPMLIQPYVENAIKHGLLHKNGPKNLTIFFDINNDETMLICTIEDNGIGRNASAEINKYRHESHQSFATSATEKRLNLLNNKNDFVSVSFDDKYDEHHVGIGTIVSISILL